MEILIRKYGVALIILFFAFKAYEQYHAIGPKNQVLRADGKGYYAYLPAVFVYHDNQMDFLHYYEAKYNLPEDYAEFRAKQNGRYLDKYYAGLAILQIPFFLIAHGISKIGGLPADGYAPLYQQFFVIGGLFYLFIGMQALMYYLIALQIRPAYALLAIILILCGTNCYHYTVYEQCMTHIYNLGLMCVFIYGMHKVIHEQSRKWIVACLFILGLIFVLRPINIIVIFFVPFIAGNWPKLKSGFGFIFKNPFYMIAGLLAASVPVIIQCSLWYWQTGHIYVYAYGKEVMEWTNPKFYHILFSYRSGWFLWSPLALVGLCGLLFFLKDRFRFVSIALFTLLFIYVISCWWTPEYGWRFGSRPYIDFLFVPATGFSMSFQKLRSWYKPAFIFICFIGLFVAQVQAYQYRHQDITWDGMNEQTYWRVFLQTGKGYDHWLYEKKEFDPQTLIDKNIDKSFFNGYETPGTWGSDGNTTNRITMTGSSSYVLDGCHIFSPAFKYQMTPEILKNDSLIQESVWFYGPQPENNRLVIKFEQNGKMVSWTDFMFRRYNTENFTWTRAVLHVPIPQNIKPGDTVMCFAYNGDSRLRFFLDDFRVDFIKKNDAF